MDTILLIGATVISSIVVVILRRISHPSNPCPRDADGYFIPGLGRGAVYFGTGSPEESVRHATETIGRITEVK